MQSFTKNERIIVLFTCGWQRFTDCTLQHCSTPLTVQVQLQSYKHKHQEQQSSTSEKAGCLAQDKTDLMHVVRMTPELHDSEKLLVHPRHVRT